MANWQNFITGSACVVQLKTGSGIPNIPGNVSKDMKATGFPVGNGTQKMSSYLEKLYPGAWRNKRYSSLPKKTGVLSQLAYTWCSLYNEPYNNLLNPIKYNLSITSNSDNCYEYYVGSNVFFICRPSHRGSGYGQNTGTIDITVTYTDGTSYKKTIKNIWQDRTDLLQNTPSDMVHVSEKLPKAIRKIDVVATYPNQGAQWHDVGDDRGTWYRDKVIQMGANTFNGNFVGNYHLENKIDFTKVRNYSVQKIEQPIFELQKKHLLNTLNLNIQGDDNVGYGFSSLSNINKPFGGLSPNKLLDMTFDQAVFVYDDKNKIFCFTLTGNAQIERTQFIKLDAIIYLDKIETMEIELTTVGLFDSVMVLGGAPITSQLYEKIKQNKGETIKIEFFY